MANRCGKNQIREIKNPYKSKTYKGFSFLAEWTGNIDNNEKPLNPTVYEGFKQPHVVKTCGKFIN
jgi:hypothetical protein